jgi:hypothetical protein
MDRDEALRMLQGGKEGVAEWNRRRAGPRIPDNTLRGANIGDANLRGVNLSLVELSGANLSGANLGGADLHSAYLNGANLIGTNFYGADLRFARLRDTNLSGNELSEADLSEASLSGTDLSGANLIRTNFRGAHLDRTNFSGADLLQANLCGAYLKGANFSGAFCHSTIFATVDLSTVRGLDSVRHQGPSTIGIDTLFISGGKIPEPFLRGCGVRDALMGYLPQIFNAMEPIQFYSCFISYSSKDTPFAERLYGDLQNKGVRCWFAPEDLKIGERIRVGIDQAIRLREKLLLVLSENSVQSEWVEKEVETAMEEERKLKRTVLFPIRLDDSVLKIENGWPADIRRTRNIGDFLRWKSHDEYQKSFERLLRDLQASDESE